MESRKKDCHRPMRLGSGAARMNAEDPVDLLDREVLVGLAGRDDQVGRELHLAEQVGVLERHVELVVHAGSPFLLVVEARPWRWPGGSGPPGRTCLPPE